MEGNALIDWSQVAQLRQEVGVEDFDEVLDLFFEEVEEVTTRLAQSTPSKDLGEGLHFLKGSALNLGFAAFSMACQKGENLCANGADAEVDVPEILAIYETSKQKFYAELPTAFQE
jgi:HPt (histidine-containing phosphotransfer) domain-containing protein